ncbi:zinc finger protein 2-like isoform X1 [Phycodurus eques]|uniref:zinc finger protein 2-like isoform X1 n=1 Tax=Phycodurus eques TaxID=693459 RepID=UPI002ACEDB33|nr:zinc finger protein 2-like isoform X1 [Phycodurus eques]
MCQLSILRTLVTQRLNVAVEEIFELVERTIADYEEELCQAKEENERQRELLNAVCESRVVSRSEDKRLVAVKREEEEEEDEVPTERQEEPAEPPDIKEEKEDVWRGQDGGRLQELEANDVTSFALTCVHVKSEEDEGPSSQLHRSQSEETLGQHVTTHEQRGGLRSPPGSIARISDMDDVTSHSSDTDRGDRTKEPSKTNTNAEGDLRRRADSKHSHCSECGKTFVHKGAFTRHMRTHSGEKPFKCAVCAKGFSLKANMKRHMAIHHELSGGSARHGTSVQFGCSVCGKTFGQKEHLIAHMKAHSAEKPFNCAVCAKGFSWKANMKKHVARHHELSGGSTQHATSVRFGCPECGKTFGQKSNLITHMKTHTGEKPFACSYCDRRFHTKLHVKRHTAIHTGEKPFSCSFCGKSFREKYDMMNHTRLHTGEKPFPCSVCAKGFSRRSYLRIHMRSHAGENVLTCSSSSRHVTTEADGGHCGDRRSQDDNFVPLSDMDNMMSHSSDTDHARSHRHLIP